MLNVQNVLKMPSGPCLSCSHLLFFCRAVSGSPTAVDEDEDEDGDEDGDEAADEITDEIANEIENEIRMHDDGGTGVVVRVLRTQLRLDVPAV